MHDSRNIAGVTFRARNTLDDSSIGVTPRGLMAALHGTRVANSTLSLYSRSTRWRLYSTRPLENVVQESVYFEPRVGHSSTAPLSRLTSITVPHVHELLF